MAFVCKECGSHDVEYKVWYKPNTEQVVGDVENEPGWCGKCDESRDIIFQCEEEEV